MIRVLFVCLGNICRSPMAHAIFLKMIKDENLENKIFVDSAATSSWEQGNPVHIGTRERLKKENISVEGMYSRKINNYDLSFDYIVGMDENNIKDILKFINNRNSGKVIKLLDKDIDDPWYTGDFDKTYEDIYRGCKNLLERVKKEIL